VKKLEDLPTMMDYDIRHGRTYMYFDGEPLYPFGYGLSYTQFEYQNPVAHGGPGVGDGIVRLAIDLSNTGTYDGDEVVQVYAEFPDSAVERPKRKLVGFRRVPTSAGETTKVSINIDPMQLAYWSIEHHAFIVEPNRTIDLHVGASSADIRQTVSIDSGKTQLNLGVIRAKCNG
jgi:beta-glucosidase